MSVTLGPTVSIDGPLPVAPPRSLLNAPNVTIIEGNSRFGNGASVWPYPPGLPEAWAACNSGTFRLKDEGEPWEIPIFAAFSLYLPISCSSITAASAGFADRARLAFQAKESYGVAHEFARGTAEPLNPHLTDLNATLLNSGTIVTPDVGLSFLEDAIGATGTQGLIHLTPATAASMNGSGGYGLDLTAGQLLTTANGTPVAIDGGYIGAKPEAVGGGAVAAGTAWAFATGPVQIYRNPNADLIPDDISEAMDREDNFVTYRAERDYLVTWDTTLQAAVLIDWTP